MSLEDWALVYMLKFGKGKHSGWVPGEKEFVTECSKDLNLSFTSTWVQLSTVLIGLTKEAS